MTALRLVARWSLRALALYGLGNAIAVAIDRTVR